MYRFRLYGLTVAADRRLPGLAESRGDADPDVYVRFSAQRGHRPADAALPVYASIRDGDDETLRVLRRTDGSFVFRFDNGARFEVSPDAARITARWPARITFADVTAYLMGPVLGFVLRLRGTICLHASAVRVRGAAVAFLGRSGWGKSSICASFAARGHAVLTDDVLALRLGHDGFRVLPGPARIRLWPDTARHLYGANARLPRVLPSDRRWDKGYRDFAPRVNSARLAAIYTGEEDQTSVPQVVACAGREAFMRLAVNRYPARLPVPGQSGREFRMLAALADRVPVRHIKALRDLRGLGALLDAVLSDLRGITTGVAPPAGAHARIAR
jgi:hypothetical protein